MEQWISMDWNELEDGYNAPEFLICCISNVERGLRIMNTTTEPGISNKSQGSGLDSCHLMSAGAANVLSKGVPYLINWSGTLF